MDIWKIKIVTILSLLILLCLQIVWSVYTYREQYHKLEKVSNSVFYTSTLSDIIKRSETYMPEGAEVIVGPVQKDGRDNYAGMQEILAQKYSAPILLSQFDSIYRDGLSSEGIHTRTIINRINTNTGEVIESTDSTFRGSWGSITTYPEYTRRDSTEAIVAVVVSPVQDVLRRVWLLYFS